ncbi:hypothetical protein IFM89_002407 [Coptis chinensis]|uniref:Leucine-rich repeat-containing N-terminal plant-type domain-containing protein n=1 Tax=Coptis chinensis TaxID=261450 RepID=A0A835M6Z3_9MAGN|nr:hypothetical protein IFM89_002407 [Coptis chinensis]
MDPIPPLSTWVDDKRSDCCTWERVKCSNSTGRVIRLSLYATYSSHQYLDESLYTPFEELQHLDLSENGVHWKIEDLERLSRLKRLEVLNLRSNIFFNKRNTAPSNKSDKSIVPFLGEWKSLKTLILGGNNLTGSLLDFGKVLTNLSNLEVLDLGANMLDGFFPFYDLRNMSKLKILDVSGNNFSGRIPPSILSLNSLEALSFSHTNIKDSVSREIPESFALSSKSLRALILSNNRLDGQISTNLFNKSLIFLRLNGNLFTGNIPNATTSKLSSLKTLDLSRNLIWGEIPTWIGNLTELKTLVLRNNSFDGPIPLEFCNLVNIEFLDLSQNYLSGPIPSCLNLTSLRYMHLQVNNLTGLMPKGLLKSPNLKTLDLKHNNLSGSIPYWLGLLTDLRDVLLKGNHFSGSIPHEFCQLNKIAILDLSHNSFIGPIPPCFSNITFGRNGAVEPAFENRIEVMFAGPAYLYVYSDHFDFDREKETIYYTVYVEQEEVEFMTKSRSDPYKGEIINFMAGMDLSCNKFTGDIPREIGALIAIRALNLSHNQLTGSIPKSLSDLKLVESLDLSHNNLSGQIPSELIGINTLEVFSVAYNNLSGRVPDMKAQFSTFGVTSYEGNPFLCGESLQMQCNTSKDSVTLTLAGLTDKFGIDPISFVSSFAATYVVYLLGFVIILYVNPHWRGLWFNFIDACLSFMFPFCSK